MPVHALKTGLVGHGMTYGEHLRAAWLEQRSKRGLVVLEKDVAMSLEGWTQLARCIDCAPDLVWAVPYPLYPASTGMDRAVWAHRVFGCAEKLLFCGAREECPSRPDAFGLGCTFLPERLLRAMPDDLRQWDYPMLDSRLSELAREIGVGCRTTSVPAIHLHY